MERFNTNNLTQWSPTFLFFLIKNLKFTVCHQSPPRPINATFLVLNSVQVPHYIIMSSKSPTFLHQGLCHERQLAQGGEGSFKMTLLKSTPHRPSPAPCTEGSTLLEESNATIDLTGGGPMRSGCKCRGNFLP